jgi:hypothetical protein
MSGICDEFTEGSSWAAQKLSCSRSAATLVRRYWKSQYGWFSTGIISRDGWRAAGSIHKSAGAQDELANVHGESLNYIRDCETVQP